LRGGGGEFAGGEKTRSCSLGGGENERVRAREWGSGEEEGEGKADRLGRGS